MATTTSDSISNNLGPSPLQWHDGNLQMHKLMNAPTRRNPTARHISPYQVQFLSICNLLAVGTIDSKGRPWTTLLGSTGSIIKVNNDLKVISIHSAVDRSYDPVIQQLLATNRDDDLCGSGMAISCLAIKLATRDRVKLSGKVLAAVILGTAGNLASMNMIMDVESSLGNCPKYLNIKEFESIKPDPLVHPDPIPLPEQAVDLLANADCFFLTAGQSTNYRGGPKGFIRVLSNTEDNVRLIYPEYSGNRLYQTLGNLIINPRIGIIIPNFHTGDALYLTCEATILAGPAAAEVIQRTNLAVLLIVEDARFVQNTLPVRAIDGEPSPYNPPVRLLVNESGKDTLSVQPQATAKLIDRVMLSKDIARLKFRTDCPISYSKGQHVALNFETELGVGYSHMRDDDPTSLNDDLNRSFTITSPASKDGNEFELVIRNVGRVTKHLITSNIRGGISCSILGFGGSFAIEQSDQTIGFLAGGVGITPLLGQIENLDSTKMHIVWTVNAKDIGFVQGAIEQWPFLKHVNLYISGHLEDHNISGIPVISVRTKRLTSKDLNGLSDISRWYVCTGPALQKSAMEWLKGKEVISESFNF